MLIDKSALQLKCNWMDWMDIWCMILWWEYIPTLHFFRISLIKYPGVFYTMRPFSRTSGNSDQTKSLHSINSFTCVGSVFFSVWFLSPHSFLQHTVQPLVRQWRRISRVSAFPLTHFISIPLFILTPVSLLSNYPGLQKSFIRRRRLEAIGMPLSCSSLPLAFSLKP